MDNYFNHKVAWITGASSGIGEALAYALAASGAKVILSSRRTPEFERVKASCAFPENVAILPLDLLDIPSLESKVPAAIDCFGRVDIMVHNGGVTQRSLVADTDLQVHRQIMELNYFSYIALTKALLPHFIERKAGHFVVTSSVMGKIGTPMRAGYAAAKHALHGYFDCLRAEVSGYNIKVTVLTPGYIHTNISKYALTDTPYGAAVSSENIDSGLPADKAAEQILKAIKRGAFEAYIGKFGLEQIALWVNRFAPSLLIKLAPKFAPK